MHVYGYTKKVFREKLEEKKKEIRSIRCDQEEERLTGCCQRRAELDAVAENECAVRAEQAAAHCL
jgi:hypothetical protein